MTGGVCAGKRKETFSMFPVYYISPLVLQFPTKINARFVQIIFEESEITNMQIIQRFLYFIFFRESAAVPNFYC